MANPSLARDDYFKALNLVKDPFLNRYSGETYYSTPEIQHRLDLIRHLLEFSQQVLLVKGPSKVGKTVFCQHLIANADEKWLVCEIEASGEIGPDTLVKEMLREHTDMIEASTETIAALNRYLEYCSHNSRIPIVFIDNADELNQATLRFIFQLMEFKEKETSIRVVLIGQDSFLNRLNEIAEEKSDSNLIHSVTIPAFSPDQTMQYLQHRISACAGREDMFSEKEMNRIHKVSAGVPGDINFLARQGLSDPAALITESPASKLTQENVNKARQIIKPVLAAAFVASIVIFFTSSLRDNASTGILTLSISLPPELPPAPVKKTGNTYSFDPEELPDAWMESQVLSTPVLDTEISEQLTEEFVPEKKLEGNGEFKSSQRLSSPSIEPEPPLIESTVAKNGKNKGKMKGRDWLLAQSDDSYVLQLMGAAQMTTITRFLQEARLDESQLALYKVEKSGKDWHVLVYGLYSDLPQARAAITALSLEAQAQNPWPKAMLTIHEAMLSQ